MSCDVSILEKWSRTEPRLCLSVSRADVSSEAHSGAFFINAVILLLPGREDWREKSGKRKHMKSIQCFTPVASFIKLDSLLKIFWLSRPCAETSWALFQAPPRAMATTVCLCAAQICHYMQRESISCSSPGSGNCSPAAIFHDLYQKYPSSPSLALRSAAPGTRLMVFPPAW